MIGDDTQITALSVCPRYVKIGIEAPQHIEVHRQEVYERIHSFTEDKTKQI